MGFLDGRRLIVTGAGRGIGAEVACACAAQGALVVVNDLGSNVDGTGADARPAQEVVARIRAAGGTAFANTGDVADSDQATELIESAVRELGGVDALINIAGIMRDHPLIDLEPGDWDAVLRVHLRGTYNTSRAVARHWVSERKGGYRLVNTTSGAGLLGSPLKPNYAAAKMGIIGFTYAVANDLMPYGVTANAVAPSARTRMNEHKALDHSTAENAASAYVYLASEASNWLTGQVIGVRDRTIRLLARPHYVGEFHSDQPTWEMASVFDRFETEFRPLVDRAPENPHETKARSLSSLAADETAGQ